MGFLKKLGIILAKGTQIALGISPLLQGGVRTGVERATSILEQVAQIVIDMEVLGNKWQLSGAQKLEGAVVQATAIFLNSAMLAGRKIQDAAMFQAGITDVVNGIVKILNSVKGDGIKTEDVVE